MVVEMFVFNRYLFNELFLIKKHAMGNMLLE
jgi:hypothetical protein